MDDRSQEQVKPVSPASAFGVSSSLLLRKKKIMSGAMGF